MDCPFYPLSLPNCMDCRIPKRDRKHIRLLLAKLLVSALGTVVWSLSACGVAAPRRHGRNVDNVSVCLCVRPGPPWSAKLESSWAAAVGSTPFLHEPCSSSANGGWGGVTAGSSDRNGLAGSRGISVQLCGHRAALWLSYMLYGTCAGGAVPPGPAVHAQGSWP